MTQQPSRVSYGEGREALMAAAIGVVAEKGLKGVTYRAIAARAGVNHTLVTHHFGSIENLLGCTMEWAVERSIRETGLERIADAGDSFADSLLASVARDPGLHLFQFEMLLESRRNPDVRAAVEQLYSGYTCTVETALRVKGRDTGGEVATAIFSALDGLMLQYLTVSDPDRIRAAVKHIGTLINALPMLADR